MFGNLVDLITEASDAARVILVVALGAAMVTIGLIGAASSRWQSDPQSPVTRAAIESCMESGGFACGL
jgi:hypothetical protein